jgi:hypothetical protein
MIPSMLHSRKPFSFATIAVDAVCLDDVFLSDREDPSAKKQPSHAFIYECLPLMTDEYCFPVHIQPATSGNAQAFQLETARTIAKTLGEPNPPVHVLFVATDGDQGYDPSYQAQFKVWYPSCWSSSLAVCLTLIGSMAPFLLETFSTWEKRITLIRAMSTIIGVLCALIMIDGDIPLDRISIHPLENFFGLLRWILHDCNKFEEFLHTAARNVIVHEIFHELCHPRDICGRKNQGGFVSRTFGKTIPDPKFTAAEAVKQIWAILPLGTSPHTYLSS